MTLQWHDNDNGVNEADLQAYVDGQLEGRRRAEIEAYLADNPDEAARLAAYRDQNIALHALFDPLIDDGEKAPPSMVALAGTLDAQFREEESPPKSMRINYRHLAACAAFMLTAGAAGWLTLDQSGWRDAPLVALTRQASDQPVQLASTGNSGEASGPQDGVQQVAGWLAAQPGKTPHRLPELEPLGFVLVTQHVIRTGDGQPAAELLYEDDTGQRVTLHMRAGGTTEGQTTFTFTRNGEDSQFFWQDTNMAYSLVGRMPQDQLLGVAEAVNQSLREAVPGEQQQEQSAQPALKPAVQTNKDAKAPTANDGARAKPADEQAIDPGIDKGNRLPEPIEAPKET